jgi:Protein of unknown function (DUF3052)
MAGYSGTPLAKKLGLKVGSNLLLAGAPTDYLDLIAPMPADMRIGARISSATDIVHVFSTRRADLEAFLVSCRSKLRPDAMVWVSWPKKSAKVPTDITEDVIREVALPLGLVDMKVCAVTDVWSGLKLVVRKELR